MNETRKKIIYNPNEDRKIEYNRRDGIILAQADCEIKIAVRIKDIERIRRGLELERQVNHHMNLSMIYSLLYGITGSSGLSIIPFLSVASISPWIIPLYICICLFSFISALCLNVFDFQQKREKKNYENNLCIEIDDIISSYIQVER